MIGYWCAHYRGLHSFVVSAEGCCQEGFRKTGGKRRRKGSSEALVVAPCTRQRSSASLDPPKGEERETGMLDALPVWWTIRRWLWRKSGALPSTGSFVDRFYLSNLDTRVPVASSAYIEIATKKYTLRYYHKRAANLWGGSGFDCRKMSGLWGFFLKTDRDGEAKAFASCLVTFLASPRIFIFTKE